MSDVIGDFELHALTHLDGRNAHKLKSLRPIFSEFAWMRQRLLVMIRYVIYMYPFVSGKNLSRAKEKSLLHLHRVFSQNDALRVKDIESKINHDLKAVEMFFVTALKRENLEECIPYINVGIGSEDVNTIAFAHALTESIQILQQELSGTVAEIMKLAREYADTTMVARTHGLPANITSFGKEMANTLLRLCDECEVFLSVKIFAKCSGEVGSFQAHFSADRRIDWIKCTDSFIRSLGFLPHHGATQVLPYDSYSRLFHAAMRINTICIDFVQNLWLYIVAGYAHVSPILREVGSAGMPHKVNPIYLEGAEGNLKMANMLFEGLARELPINRLQRSFTDSTMRRNVVIPISFSLLAYQSITEGLKRFVVDRKAIAADFVKHPEVWLESVKAYGMVHKVPDMFGMLKNETRGKVLTAEGLTRIIEQLPLTKLQKDELLALCRQSANPFPSAIVSEALTRTKKVFSL